MLGRVLTCVVILKFTTFLNIFYILFVFVFVGVEKKVELFIRISMI